MLTQCAYLLSECTIRAALADEITFIVICLAASLIIGNILARFLIPDNRMR